MVLKLVDMRLGDLNEGRWVNVLNVGRNWSGKCTGF